MESKHDKAGLYFFGSVVGFLLAAFFVYAVYAPNRPRTPDEVRAEIRRENLAEIKAAEKAFLDAYAWLDAEKGIVGMPVSRAMDVMVSEWEDPKKGRSALLSRLKQSGKTAPPAQ